MIKPLQEDLEDYEGPIWYKGPFSFYHRFFRGTYTVRDREHDLSASSEISLLDATGKLREKIRNTHPWDRKELVEKSKFKLMPIIDCPPGLEDIHQKFLSILLKK